MPKATDGPDLIDVHVGQRMRLRRIAMRLSQERLAEALGISFQQIQKYEKGANRISASKLFRIAHVLEVPINFFFEGLEDSAAPQDDRCAEVWAAVVRSMLAEPSGSALADAFLRIRRRSVRKGLADLARAIAVEEPDLDLETAARVIAKSR